MKKPINQLTEVLYELIRKRKVSHRNFQMQDFRKHVSVLRLTHNLNLKSERISDVNRYNNPYSYCTHSLPENQREKAIKLYEKLIC